MARVSKIRLASIAEASCGLFVLSMPSLRVLFRKKTPNEITPITVASYDGNIEIGSPTLWGKTQSTKLQGGKYHPFVEMNPVKPPALRSPRFSK